LTEYHNPQNDPGSEKRLLLVLLVVFVMIAVMPYLLPKPQPRPEQQKPAGQSQAEATPEAPKAVPTASPTAKASPAAKAQAPPAAVAVKQATAETETVLENENYSVTVTNRGAVVKHWILKKFKDNNGKVLDLVNPKLVESLGAPLSMFAYDKDLESKINQGLYVVSGTGAQNGPVTFEYSDGQLAVRKVFRPEKGYVVGLETEVAVKGQRVTAFPRWSSGLGDQATLASYAGAKIDWDRSGNIEHKAAVSGSFFTGGKKSLSSGDTVSGPFLWAGTADQYFAVVFMPASPKDTTVVTLNNQAEVPRDPSKPEEAKEKVSVLGVAVGNLAGLSQQRIFAGPKTVEVLESTQVQPGVGPDLRGLTDFGFFGFIARPLFLWLKWTYQHWIHNWGWAIVFLTLVITTALLPLRIAGMKSSLKMQKIQPQMKALQEKYKRYGITDPRRAEMQKEMSELYKREGVNPVGGCFPMLLQMPFLFAFYSMLANAIELRQASWLWIKDLSAPDPYHILPIIIIILMFVSQRSMPQTGMDPAQQKMMTFMGPVMFGVLSWSMAAGLSVYWMVSNLLGYVQQVMMNRSALGQQVRKGQERRTTRKR
jgi:YidC/Oxa1 family membrane protein insertase